MHRWQLKYMLVLLVFGSVVLGSRDKTCYHSSDLTGHGWTNRSLTCASGEDAVYLDILQSQGVIDVVCCQHPSLGMQHELMCFLQIQIDNATHLQSCS